MTPSTSPIRLASSKDLHYVLSLQKKFSNELGFLPTAAIEWYLQNDRVTLALENGEPAGYTLARPKLRWMWAIRPITQAAIQYDAQKRHLGLALLSTAEAEARNNGQVALQVMCREGIDANEFWRIAGFTLIGQIDPRSQRRRQINCWRKSTHEYVPPWFHSLPPVAGHLARKATHVAEKTPTTRPGANPHRPMPKLRRIHKTWREILSAM